MDLPGAAAAGGDPAGDLPQADRLPFARPVVDAQRDGGVGQVVGVLPAAVIGAGDGGERVGGDVGGRALAPGQQVEPGLHLTPAGVVGTRLGTGFPGLSYEVFHGSSASGSGTPTSPILVMTSLV